MERYKDNFLIDIEIIESKTSLTIFKEDENFNPNEIREFVNSKGCSCLIYDGEDKKSSLIFREIDNDSMKDFLFFGTNDLVKTTDHTWLKEERRINTLLREKGIVIEKKEDKSIGYFKYFKEFQGIKFIVEHSANTTYTWSKEETSKLINLSK